MKISSKYKKFTEFLILFAVSSLNKLELKLCDFKSCLFKEGYFTSFDS